MRRTSLVNNSPSIRRLTSNSSNSYRNRFNRSEDCLDVDNTITDISNLLDEKFKDLNTRLSNIENIVQHKQVAFDTNQLTVEAQYTNLKHNYETLETKYKCLLNMHEQQFYKLSRLMMSYQSMLFKMCSSTLQSDPNNLYTEECHKMSEVLRTMSCTSSDYEIPRLPLDSIVTNPVVSKKDAPPIIKSTSRDTLKKQNTDAELIAILESE